MARKSKREVMDQLKEAGIEFDPEAPYGDLCDLLKSQRRSAPELSSFEPLIKPVRNDAMCGNATIQDHEDRLFALETIVAMLLEDK
jgi:hypothetical protein